MVGIQIAIQHGGLILALLLTTIVTGLIVGAVSLAFPDALTSPRAPSRTPLSPVAVPGSAQRVSAARREQSSSKPYGINPHIDTSIDILVGLARLALATVALVTVAATVYYFW